MGFGGFGFNTAQGTVGGFAPAQGGSDFTPADLTGLVDWWDAGAAYVTKRGGGAPSNNDPVLQWTGRVNSIDLDQAVEVEQPLWIASGQNSQPVVRFDGVDDYLVSAGFGAKSQPNTIFAAIKVDAPVIGDTIFDGITGGRNALIINADKFKPYAGSYAAGPSKDANFNILTCIYNSTASAIRVSGSETAGIDAGVDDMDGLTVAANITPAAFTGMDIAEIIIVDGLSSAADIAATESYLMSKYGI